MLLLAQVSKSSSDIENILKKVWRQIEDSQELSYIDND